MKYSFVVILAVAVVIVFFGVSTIYSSTYQKESKSWQEIYKRQALWAAAGIAVYLLLAGTNYRRLWDWTYFLGGAVVALLLLVDLLGLTALGAQRWLKLWVINFQPSEFAKLAVVVFLARYYSRKSYKTMYLLARNKGIVQSVVIPFAITAVPMMLIIQQPDLGSGMIIFFIFIAMVFMAGVKGKHLAALLAACVIPAPLFWHVLRNYQKDRLLVFLNPDRDPLGAGYTVIQSKIAIGSGGIFGKGWLAGTQSQLHFLPESHTDFIFATYAEQWGLLGSSLLLGLYYVIIRQGFAIAQRTNDHFGRMLAGGISCMLCVQICVNIAMNMGFAPVVGVPLPLMSYGGSSVLVSFIALGILVNIDRKRTVF